LLASQKVNDRDLEEGSPDHLGEPLNVAEAGGTDSSTPPPTTKPVPVNSGIVQAAMREREMQPALPITEQQKPVSDDRPAMATSGTVVLDVEQGGIVVPSFIGKTVRSAIESAQESGLELNALGSGVGHEQSPAPGTHVAAGTRVMVKFER